MPLCASPLSGHTSRWCVVFVVHCTWSAPQDLCPHGPPQICHPGLRCHGCSCQPTCMQWQRAGSQVRTVADDVHLQACIGAGVAEAGCRAWEGCVVLGQAQRLHKGLSFRRQGCPAAAVQFRWLADMLPVHLPNLQGSATGGSKTSQLQHSPTMMATDLMGLLLMAPVWRSPMHHLLSVCCLTQSDLWINHDLVPPLKQRIAICARLAKCGCSA